MAIPIEHINKVTQNLKIIKVMKASNYTDREISDYLGIGVKTFLEIINADDYLREVYEQAQQKLASEIESKFLENVLQQLDDGNTTDAKWVLERTNDKYNKKDKVDVSVRTIDDIILGGN